MALYQRFFEAAKIDLEAAKALKDKQLYQPAIYHLQQAYEKCVKSYFILKEIRIQNIPEAIAYNNVVRFGHDTEESTIALLKDMVTIEENGYRSNLPNLSDEQQIQAVQRVIDVIDSYKSSLDRYVQKLNLSKNYINNIRNYSNYITSKYEYHQKSVNNIIVKEPDKRFLYIFSCMANVYPLLYKMESITRYPLREFSYGNLDLLTNQHNSCEKIIEILDEMFSLVSKDLK